MFAFGLFQDGQITDTVEKVTESFKCKPVEGNGSIFSLLSGFISPLKKILYRCYLDKHLDAGLI